MKTVEITADRQNCPYPALSAEFQIGDDLREIVSQFGEEVVGVHARRSILTSAQSFLRGLIDKAVDNNTPYEKLLEEARTAMKEWKPSKRRVAKTTEEKVEQALARMSPAERRSFLREYEAKLARATEREAAE